jgi:putative flippase GtrA
VLRYFTHPLAIMIIPTSEFLRFCIVGLIAFVVDAAVLFALVYVGLTDAIARSVSLTLGMQTAYILNARFTFRGHRGIGLATWASFVTSNLLGAALNYLIFLAALHWVPITHADALRLLAIICGTGVGLIFNYWANRRFAFARKDS